MTLGAEKLGTRIVERSIDRTEPHTCDELLLLCGTGVQIAPVVEVDRGLVGDGKVGELSQELQSLYFGAARGDKPNYSSGSLPVY